MSLSGADQRAQWFVIEVALCGRVIGVAVGDGVHGAWPLYAFAFAVVIVRKSVSPAADFVQSEPI